MFNIINPSQWDCSSCCIYILRSCLLFSGKTTLIKALTHDSEMHPEDKLFATLDVTAHKGKLPCGLTALFIDTVGFVSDLPHELVASFSATLEDIIHSVS